MIPKTSSAQHWRQLDDNPVAPEVTRLLQTQVLSRRQGFLSDYWEYLRHTVSGKTVLDIGAVEHDWEHVRSPRWKHRRLVAWAQKVVGVDILSDYAAALTAEGFDIRNVDACGPTDLGERFDVIIIGDVIEHVDDPSAMLRFARRHLAVGGVIVVKTPNPFYWRYVWRTLRIGTLVANAEHVRWVSPTMALELGYRADLNLYRYRLLGRGRKAALFELLLRAVGDGTELIGYDFVFEYTVPATEVSETASGPDT